MLDLLSGALLISFAKLLFYAFAIRILSMAVLNSDCLDANGEALSQWLWIAMSHGM
jgi:hypothetical protein